MYKYVPKSNPDPNAICNTLWNSKTYFSKCVAYCENKGKYLTVKQMRTKECLGKQCKYLVKIEDRPFWKWHEQRKENRKNKAAEQAAFSV